MDKLPGVRIVLGMVMVFFLPGFAWTLVFFQGRRINVLERLALSFGLSIAVVVLSILALNFGLGVSITGFNSAMIILVVTAVPVAIYFIRRWLGRRGSSAGSIGETSSE
jgi:uncharacterized membrane protein